MKHDDKKKRFGKKQRSVKSGDLTARAGPELREFWAELQRAKAAGGPLPVAPHALGGNVRQNTPSYSSGSFRSSGSGGSGSGSGSGGAGYGLALIAPDPESQERIRRIMRSLCEKDAKRTY